MEINVRRQSNVQVVKLRGDLKIGEAVDDFRATMEGHRRGGSSGIGMLVRSLSSAKRRGGSIKLVKPAKLAVQTLKIVGLLNLFEIFDDEAAAVASFQ